MRTLKEIRDEIKLTREKLTELYNEEHEAQFTDLGFSKGDYVHMCNLGCDYYIYLKNVWESNGDVFFEGCTLYFDNGEYLEDTFARWGMWEQNVFKLADLITPTKKSYIEKIDKIIFNSKFQEMLGILQENHKDIMNNGWAD